MAVPKRKQSKARRDKRRSNVWKLEAPTLVKCPQCGELKVPHQVCGKCGYYKGREVVKVSKEAWAKVSEQGGGAALSFSFCRSMV